MGKKIFFGLRKFLTKKFFGLSIFHTCQGTPVGGHFWTWKIFDEKKIFLDLVFFTPVRGHLSGDIFGLMKFLTKKKFFGLRKFLSKKFFGLSIFHTCQGTTVGGHFWT